MSDNDPFGRQPQPVRVELYGDQRDIDLFISLLRAAAERTDASTQRMGNQFKIYPRAVND
jgi:hypothetical protein